MIKGIWLKNISLFLFLVFNTSVFVFSCDGLHPVEGDAEKEGQYEIVVPMGGNSWIMNNFQQGSSLISNGGIKNWSDPGTRIRTWFRTEKSGTVNIALKAKVSTGKSAIKVTFGNKIHEVGIKGTDFQVIPAGSFIVEQPGYHYIELQGLSKAGSYFAEVESIFLGGDAVSGKVYFVKDDFYWGRRGPSVHLNYQLPEGVGDIEWFYNEITIPEGNDVEGSYFMANGFAEGYFGIQVNSLTERRILFSVWSPYKTDNPGEIPENYRIKMLKKGDGVHTGEFGNEGSGGQSYLKYYWKAGNTYRFLLRSQPSPEGYTDFTAWFFPPETGKWLLIASFRRPQTKTYLNRLHSFLENFHTETGYISRKGYYGNQWICNMKGTWIELVKVRFTADATARKDARLDYTGGMESGDFFLKNCGFFNERTLIDSYFERQAKGIPPVINFNDLP